jgi:hypothetical protein
MGHVVMLARGPDDSACSGKVFKNNIETPGSKIKKKICGPIRVEAVLSNDCAPSFPDPYLRFPRIKFHLVHRCPEILI